MAYEDILYTKEDKIARITINRPDKGNMFRPHTMVEIKNALEDARFDEDARVVVISGAGGKFFCIGGEKVGDPESYSYKYVQPTFDVYDMIDKLPKPVIAAVDGYAVGGGHVLHVVCDLTIATDRSIFRQVGPMMGSFDAGYGTWYLEDTVGKKKAKEIWYLCRKYTAQEALAMGLVNAVVPPEQFEDEVNKWCRELIQKGPQALWALKASFTAKHSGVVGFTRVAADLLATYYFPTQEPKELSRAFNAKEEPDQSKFYK
ncbi:MAG: enoyl-CoA hydratase-related protein [Pseudomonadota bacterium]